MSRLEKHSGEGHRERGRGQLRVEELIRLMEATGLSILEVQPRIIMQMYKYLRPITYLPSACGSHNAMLQLVHLHFRIIHDSNNLYCLSE